MIGLYRGTSLLSRAIQWRTWSCYSHASWICRDRQHCYEAWKEGVTYGRIDAHHKPGTVIDLFEVDLPRKYHYAEAEFYREVEKHLATQLGKKYDIRGLLSFVSRREKQNQDRWFCSELVFWALEQAGALLLRAPAYKVAPGTLSLSPLLRPVGKIVCGELKGQT